jgi:uncharacterized membrane protein YeaQ/YmgE (transglycosylase-associated protein family)
MMHEPMGLFGMPGVGFLGMLLVGFLAGWIAERAMNRDHGLLTNILVGIAGSFVGGTLANVLGIYFYGFIGNLVIASAGAILILWFFGKNEPGNRNRDNPDQASAPGGPMYHSADDKDRKA